MQNAADQRESNNAAPAEWFGPGPGPVDLLSSNFDVGCDSLRQATVRRPEMWT